MTYGHDSECGNLTRTVYEGTSCQTENSSNSTTMSIGCSLAAEEKPGYSAIYTNFLFYANTPECGNNKGGGNIYGNSATLLCLIVRYF